MEWIYSSYYDAWILWKNGMIVKGIVFGKSQPQLMTILNSTMQIP